MIPHTEQKPILAELTPELRSVQSAWLSLSRSEQDKLYATAFAKPFCELFAKLPLHGAPPGMKRARALVSVLGFSWQPVALMATWVKPERMLVIGTDDSLAVHVDDEGVLSLIARIAGVSRDLIEPIRVGDAGEAQI